MFFFRFATLVILMSIGYIMFDIPYRNAFGEIMYGLFFLLAPLLYILPSYEAWLKKHPNINSIAIVNIFLGWTLLGWAVALAWAFKKPELISTENSRKPINNSEVKIKNCPYCAEEILFAAIKCKHCSSDLLVGLRKLK